MKCMDTSQITDKLKARQKTGRGRIHSAHHALADRLAKELNDPKHFGAYLKLAITHDHQKLLNLLGQIKENSNAKTPAKLFMYMVKNSLK